MSATAFPYGMVPVGKRSAGYNSQGFETIPIASGYATDIFFGDVVKLATTGSVQKDTGTVTLTPVGVFLGCSYTDPVSGRVIHSQRWPASTVATDAKAKVDTDPLSLFKIQADASLTQAAVGANAAIVQTAGVTTIGKSKNALQASSVAVTSTLPLRIVALSTAAGEQDGDAFTDMIVMFNNHQYNTLTGI